MDTPRSDFVKKEGKSAFAFKAFLVYIGTVLCLISVCAVFWCGILGVTYIINKRPATISVETLGIGSTMISERDGMTMVYVPAGDFVMGSDDNTNDEKPVHTVYLDAYWIDQTEVTNAMYEKCVNVQVCDPPSSKASVTRDRYYDNPEFDQFPVIFVSWNDAQRYCTWAERRLPSEAQWEKAASWNEEGQEKFVYPWGNTFDYSKLNSCDKNCPDGYNDKAASDGYADTAPVGSYKSGQSSYGAYDMAGNVWEWVSSQYKSYPYNYADGREGLSSTDARVLRGGALGINFGSSVYTTRRLSLIPSKTSDIVGFRCASSLLNNPTQNLHSLIR